jgi:acyl-CoA reductase-like NAD-dependent aldehyde dehydrogenase
MNSPTLVAVDPRTGSAGASYAETDARQLDRVLAAAHSARDDTGWASAPARAGALVGIAERLRAEGDAIIASCEAETGLSRARLGSELERTWRQVLAFAALLRSGEHYEARIDPADPDARPAARPDLRRMMVPVGPVAVFAASNFPLAFSVAGGDTASALAAGCPVICKAHPGHPGTSAMIAGEIAAAIADQGLPPGWFSLVQSASIGLALELVRDERIEAVAFTGSGQAGRAIFDAAAGRPRPIPVFAEMGSVNPVVVTEAAIGARAASIAAALGGSITRDAGQLCTKPGLIFVPAGSAGASLLAALREVVAGADTGVMLNEHLFAAASTAAGELARYPSVEALLDADAPRPATAGFALPAAVFTTSSEALRAHPELRDERFGPLALLVSYGDLDDLLDTLDVLPGQLTATLHATDADRELGRTIAEHLLPRAGRLIYNGVPTGVSVTAAMQHGGPYPATTAAAHTSVGTAATKRFLRPVVWQNAPDWMLPEPLRDGNPLGIPRVVDAGP